MNLTAHNTRRPAVGSISCGTHREADLLRTFADAYQAALPFNGRRMADEARDIAARLDADFMPSALLCLEAQEALHDLQIELEAIAAVHGLTFGTLEGDGADFGFWQNEESSDAD